MSNYNSQEQTIYRSLAGKIQLGFYDKEERFPSAKEIARRYQVSYCPAQRALKMLEKDGLIRLCRGKATVVLAKPYEDYLGSPVFFQRAEALLDLCKCLKLISPAISFHNIRGMRNEISSPLPEKGPAAGTAQELFTLFEQSLHIMRSHSVLSLYYDVSCFAESAFLDICSSSCGQEETLLLWRTLADSYNDCMRHFGEYGREECLSRLEQMSSLFYDTIISYLANLPSLPPEDSRVPFVWEPHKGRTRYCDIIAIDVICKINQGVYPVGTLLPKGAVLADIYHVSEITIRRTIHLLNRLGVTQTFNGIGTRVSKKGDSSIPHKLRELTLDDNMKCFLEALQLLAILTEPVIRHTFPHIPADTLHKLYETAGGKTKRRQWSARQACFYRLSSITAPCFPCGKSTAGSPISCCTAVSCVSKKPVRKPCPAGLQWQPPYGRGAFPPKAVRWHRPAVFYLKTTLPPPNKPLWKSGSKERRK